MNRRIWGASLLAGILGWNLMACYVAPRTVVPPAPQLPVRQLHGSAPCYYWENFKHEGCALDGTYYTVTEN